MSSADTLLFNKVLNEALEKRASDIHLTVGNYPVLRIGSALSSLTGEQVLNPDFITSALEMVITPADRERLQKEREVITTYSWSNRARFRVQVFFQKGYPALSLRQIPDQIINPKDLGLSSVVINAADQTKGLILVIGPYHSGRTTTVFSLLDSINQRLGKHILTLEQPIEYLLVNAKSLITQREVGKDVPTFLEGLRQAIDEDVDVVAITASDAVPAEAVLELVESGKLVIYVISGQSVVTALELFLASIPAERASWGRQIVADNLLVATAQRLVPKIAGGLALGYEILTVSAAVKSVMRDGNFYQLNNVMATSRQDGMISLDRHLADLVKQGTIAADQAAKFALDPKTLQLSITK